MFSVTRCKSYNKEVIEINHFYCPELVPIIIKTTKLIPLWSAVMIPTFGYEIILTFKNEGKQK